MIRCPNMLMVGAAGRNLGKTTFICRVIERLSKSQPVVAIKVTAFDDVDGTIIAETQKCQTYKTLDGRFMVTREAEGSDEKDTHRMFHGGAEKVYWLRTLKSTLAIVPAFIFDRKSFCRYGCFVGRISGLYANFSPIEVRSANSEVCAG